MIRSNDHEINALLDSDDEFPTDYTEDHESPAYENDHRFELNIKFGWLNNVKKIPKLKTSPSKTLFDNGVNEDNVENIVKNSPDRKAIIAKKILDKNDLYCLRHVANNIDDKFLLWFFNFLLYKDMHSEFTSQKTCLVVDSHPNFNKVPNTNNLVYAENKFKFDIVITKIY